ncbi:MAG: hypothetical protein HFK10_08705 [Clostridia bacterium]|nr:hypothetical protein [Clostridia bacterium]
MKLIMAIINDRDVAEATGEMLKGSFSLTKIGSSGGLFKGGMTTVISAVEDGRVPAALEILRRTCKARRYSAAEVEGAYQIPNMGGGITVGGATVFVLNIEETYKI